MRQRIHQSLTALSALVLLLSGGPTTLATPTSPASVQARDLDGASYQIPDPRVAATVLIFIAHDCPNANRYLPEIERLRARYSSRGVRFLTVYAEPGLTLDAARRHRKEFAVEAPAILERWQQLVPATGVTVTPEAAVLGPSGKLIYRGRIDDRYAELGRARPRPTRQDLEAALQAILTGKPVAVPRTRAVGCFISLP
jgi:hypothetical protein